MSTARTDQICAFQDVPGKGKCLIALQTIPKGTRILSEKALLIRDQDHFNIERSQNSIYRQVANLDEGQRRVFLSMRNIHPYKNAAEKYFGIFRTMALPADNYEHNTAIFLEASRINHACDNNAQKAWNEEIKQHTVHALKDIEMGTEITITYIAPLKRRLARQSALKRGFGFTCSCSLCCLPAVQSQESDKRLEEIFFLDGTIDRFGIEGLLISPLQTLSYFDRQVQLYTEEGREDVGFAQALCNAARLCISNSDFARGRIFAERAASFGKRPLAVIASKLSDLNF